MDDEDFAMPACVICRVQDGRVTSLREYLDLTHTQPLTAPRGAEPAPARTSRGRAAAAMPVHGAGPPAAQRQNKGLSLRQAARDLLAGIVRLPSLKFLKTFQVAAARESFKAAADELFVTPSAVSHQIRALEQQLGVLLFERGPHSLTLTEAGRRYLQHMDSVFARLETVTEQIRNRYARDVVRLRVPPFFATELLLPHLPSFLESQPDMDIHINTGPTLLPAHAADADVSIVVGGGPDELHECRALFSQKFVPACAPCLLERMPVGTIDALQRQTLIVHEGRHDGWQRWAQTIGVELHPRKLVRVDTMHAAVHAAERGVGVALVSTPLSAERFARRSLVKLFDAELETGESYALMVRREDAARPDVGALVTWLLEQFAVVA